MAEYTYRIWTNSRGVKGLVVVFQRVGEPIVRALKVDYDIRPQDPSESRQQTVDWCPVPEWAKFPAVWQSYSPSGLFRVEGPVRKSYAGLKGILDRSLRFVAENASGTSSWEVPLVAPPLTPWGTVQPPTWAADAGSQSDLQNEQSKHRSYTMNTKEVITLLQLTNGATVFGARYLDKEAPPRSGSVYHFKNVLGAKLSIGELVVVETRGSYALVRVSDPDVNLLELDISVDWLGHLVSKVDLSEYEGVLAAERAAVAKLAMSEVNERLEGYRRQLGGSFDGVREALMGGPRAVPPADPDYGQAE